MEKKEKAEKETVRFELSDKEKRREAGRAKKDSTRDGVERKCR